MARDALLDMYLKDISGFPVLTREQEGAVSRRLRAGDKAARQEMIQCNLRLVVSVARQYENQGLQVIGVTYPPTNTADVRRFLRRHQVSYPVLLGTRATKTLFDEGETLPFTVVIDRSGNVREFIEGILLPEEFEEKVRPLLARGVAEPPDAAQSFRTRRRGP